MPGTTLPSYQFILDEGWKWSLIFIELVICFCRTRTPQILKTKINTWQLFFLRHVRRTTIFKPSKRRIYTRKKNKQLINEPHTGGDIKIIVLAVYLPIYGRVCAYIIISGITH